MSLTEAMGRGASMRATVFGKQHARNMKVEPLDEPLASLLASPH